jgi:hypothetical protein
MLAVVKMAAMRNSTITITVESRLSELRLTETRVNRNALSGAAIPRTACRETPLSLSPSVCCERLTCADKWQIDVCVLRTVQF